MINLVRWALGFDLLGCLFCVDTGITGRYELGDQSWALISDLVSHRQQRGRRCKNDSLMPNGVFWVLFSGAKWHDLPRHFGAGQTVYHRFRIWRNRLLLRLCSNSFIWI
ncbi:transposase [Pseudomonas sp. LTJR-52]|uniref:transposase n=1 Tax=Pseudomonas sp. LTJR-52 TaxID=2479392 RepID=UPI00355882F2